MRWYCSEGWCALLRYLLCIASTTATEKYKKAPPPPAFLHHQNKSRPQTPTPKKTNHTPPNQHPPHFLPRPRPPPHPLHAPPGYQHSRRPRARASRAPTCLPRSNALDPDHDVEQTISPFAQTRCRRRSPLRLRPSRTCCLLRLSAPLVGGGFS